MTPFVQSSVRVTVLSAAAFLVSAITGCGGPPPANITERLWVSKLPTSPKATVSAFVISDVKNRQLGVFYHGSVYRGVHEMFTWSDETGATGKMKLLQDGSVYEVRTEKCEPSQGFDHCILVHGDPMQVVRYESRKRWALRKKGKDAVDFEAVVRDLAEDDEDLLALTADQG